jgi:hypothetical protein
MVCALVSVAAAQPDSSGADSAQTLMPADSAQIMSVAGSDSSAGNVSAVNSEVDTAGLADSLVRADSIARDSADSATLGVPPAEADDGRRESPGRQGGAAAADTSFRFWHKRFAGLGAGWQLGSMALFEKWATSLPESEFYLDTITDDLRFRIHDEPTAYHAAFPLHATMSLFARPGAHLTADLRGVWFTKSYIASLQYPDSLTLADYTERLSFFAASIGATWRLRIPGDYFAITGVDAAFTEIGLDITPWAHMRISRSVEDFAGIVQTTNDGRGYGLGWRAGISTFRRVAPGRGISIGARYQGTWYGGFVDADRQDMRWKAVAPQSHEPDHALGFINHRFGLFVTLLFGSSSTALSPAHGNSDS